MRPREDEPSPCVSSSLIFEARAENVNAGAHVPIVIEGDVFVGMEALILKGVTVG